MSVRKKCVNRKTDQNCEFRPSVIYNFETFASSKAITFCYIFITNKHYNSPVYMSIMSSIETYLWLVIAELQHSLVP